MEQQQLAEALAVRLEQAKLSLMVAIGLETQAVAGVTAAEAHVATIGSRVAATRREKAAAVAALGRQRARVQRSAVQAYTGGSLRRVAYVLQSDDIKAVPRRIGLAGGAFGAFEEHLRDQEAALGDLVAEHRELSRVLFVAEERLLAAQNIATGASADVARQRAEVAALDAGQALTTAGIAFPVAAPNRFSDTFGAPRMVGTRYAHAHQGVDIFASPGAPVVAFERGVVARLGTDVLGGTKLWLVGQSGTRYYYAHLQGYAPGLVEGSVVAAGQPVAYVGNTGNARTTPHHLHFEIHPGGGPAVNPYPLVAQIVEAARRTAAGDSGAVRAASGTAVAPR